MNRTHTEPSAAAGHSSAAAEPASSDSGLASGGTRRKRRRVVLPLVLVAAIGGAAAWGATRPWEPRGSVAGQPALGHGVVAVEEGSLSSSIQVGGTLAYDAPTPVIASGRGTFTALPAVGSVVKAGGQLYEVDGRPVVLMTGNRPLWRDLGPGAGDGPDVEQLKRNLVALGHADGLGLAVDERFTPGTATAVKRWQKALGVKQTGTVALGSVVMLPQAGVRVHKLGVQLGSPLGATSALTVTGTHLVAVVQPADNQLSRFTPHGKVVVKLAEGGTVHGRIRSLIRGGGADGDEGDGGAGGSGGQQKTTVTIVLDDQRQARQAGPSSVTVNVVGDTAADALIVPVTALLALDGGGYGVKVVSGTTTRLVKVRLGLVADARAQITGAVKRGDQVVIPK
ncbi:peptidoglycan-binding protein [Streptomyces sp. NBC_01255]|uniref:peptidoglycan-binding protein n=1 Tax=Streptomyces sp. NBC_01255 TaxID=2903798 RepID=UPI002E34F20E|nr:peptidoglycan-binding protein [Streptomyces sp. NBC_01255]